MVCLTTCRYFQYILEYFNILVQYIGSTLWCASPPADISNIFWNISTFWFNILVLHYGVPHHLQIFPIYFGIFQHFGSIYWFYIMVCLTTCRYFQYFGMLGPMPPSGRR